MSKFHGGVIYAVDLERMTAFYRSLGFTVEAFDPGDHAVLAASGTELSIVQIPEATARDIAIGRPPEIRSRTPIKLVLIVPSLEEACETMSALGGFVAPHATRWTFRGHVVQDVVDPEGNVLQLREALGE